MMNIFFFFNWVLIEVFNFGLVGHVSQTAHLRFIICKLSNGFLTSRQQGEKVEGTRWLKFHYFQHFMSGNNILNT